MTVAHSDAIVFFGVTGDLAYKKIFPALQALGNATPLYEYEPGTWGPAESQRSLTPKEDGTIPSPRKASHDARHFDWVRHATRWEKIS